MFEKAAISNPSDLNTVLNIGRLIEAMLYYKKVEVVFNQETFPVLWRCLGKDGTRSLLNHPSLDITLSSDSTTILRKKSPEGTIYSRMYARNGGQAGDFTTEDVAKSYHIFISREFPDISERDISSITDSIRQQNLQGMFAGETDVDDLLYAQITDPEALRQLAQCLHNISGKSDVIQFPSDLDLQIITRNSEFCIAGNHDMSSIGLNDDSLHLILKLALAISHIYNFSHLKGGDIVADSRIYDIMSSKIGAILKNDKNQTNKHEPFEEMLFEHHPVAQSFNSGAIDLDKCLTLIDKTQKFREWLHDVPPDANVLREYHKAIAQDTWLDKLPGKVGRYSFFAMIGFGLDALGAGGAGAAAGVAASAFDSFFLDRLVRGWRPNSFVEQVNKAVNC